MVYVWAIRKTAEQSKREEKNQIVTTKRASSRREKNTQQTHQADNWIAQRGKWKKQNNNNEPAYNANALHAVKWNIKWNTQH